MVCFFSQHIICIVWSNKIALHFHGTFNVVYLHSSSQRSSKHNVASWQGGTSKQMTTVCKQDNQKFKGTQTTLNPIFYISVNRPAVNPSCGPVLNLHGHLIFRESHGFTNLRTKKVLAKFKWYTVVAWCCNHNNTCTCIWFALRILKNALFCLPCKICKCSYWCFYQV